MRNVVSGGRSESGIGSSDAHPLLASRKKQNSGIVVTVTRIMMSKHGWDVSFYTRRCVVPVRDELPVCVRAHMLIMYVPIC